MKVFVPVILDDTADKYLVVTESKGTIFCSNDDELQSFLETADEYDDTEAVQIYTLTQTASVDDVPVATQESESTQSEKPKTSDVIELVQDLLETLKKGL